MSRWQASFVISSFVIYLLTVAQKQYTFLDRYTARYYILCRLLRSNIVMNGFRIQWRTSVAYECIGRDTIRAVNVTFFRFWCYCSERKRNDGDSFERSLITGTPKSYHTRRNTSYLGTKVLQHIGRPANNTTKQCTLFSVDINGRRTYYGYTIVLFSNDTN